MQLNTTNQTFPSSAARIRRARSERGAILLILTLSIILLIGLVAIVINVSYSRVIDGDLQAAADSVAHAASFKLCSKNECYEKAIESALQALAAQGEHGPLSSTGFPAGLDPDRAKSQPV